MGIRFACHACQKPLNIKSELAGKRGVCPQCGVRFRIPLNDTALSIPLDEGRREAIDDLELEDDGENLESPPYSSASAVRTGIGRVPQLEAVGSPSNEDKTRPSLLDDATATWYVRPPSGGQYGPATGEMLRGWISEARVTPTSLVWRDGWAQWRSAGEALVEFSGNKASESVAPTVAPFVVSVRSSATVQPHVSAVELAGDATIGARKSKITQRRFVIVGTLAAISMTLVGLLIFLMNRE